MLTASIAPRELQKLTRAFRAVAAATSRDARGVVRGFVGSVLKQWAGRTKVSTVQKADYRTRAQVIKSLDLTKATDPGDVSVNAGIRSAFGRVWVRSKQPKRGAGRPYRMALQLSPDGSTLRWRDFHWSDKQYIDIAETADLVIRRLPKWIQRGRAAIGLARQSVIQIADALKIDLTRVPGTGVSPAGVAKARAAMASNGHRYTNGLGQEEDSLRGLFITLINNYPLAEKLKMDQTLAGVLTGQVKYFDRNIEEGVFLSQREVARAYPFLKVIL